MRVGLIHYTPDLHKLTEMLARQCYQSFHKLAPDSHSFIRGIMAKGHISIASTGNMVFGVAGIQSVDEYAAITTDLLTMKEINNFIRWTKPDEKKNPDSKIGIIISMNMLSFLDLYNNKDNYVFETKLFDNMLHLVNGVPELKWFYDRDTEVEPSDNSYTSLPEPELYNPTVLSQDYTTLKEKGLTEYELDIHSTVTVNMEVSRDIGLQMWRHADMVGGTELSQRYVKRDSADIRPLDGFEQGVYPEKLSKYAEECNISLEKAQATWDKNVREFYGEVHGSITLYVWFRDKLVEMGVRMSRAKEIARAILPNAVTTKIIQCRPLRQWKHFFGLRDSVHAQKEMELDAKSLVKAFKESGIELD